MEKPRQASDRLYEEQRQQLVRLLRQIPSVAKAAREFSELSLRDKYRVVIPADVMSKIRIGDARFGESATGGLTANVHDTSTGRIIGQISVKQLTPNLLESLNQMALQSSLREISLRLEEVEERIEEILKGQQDDRYGLIDSGAHLFVLASQSRDPETRRLLLIDAISQLSEGRGRLIRAFITDARVIEDIPKRKWGIILASLRKNLPKKVERKAADLERSLRNVVRASALMALSCGQLGEPHPMRESWQPLDDLVARGRAVRETVVRWLPDDPKALPDGLSTELSVGERILETGKRLESGQASSLAFEVAPHEMLEGETE